MIQNYKKNTVDDIKERIDGAKSIVLLDYKGINVEEVNELRRRMFEDNVDYFVSRNAFIKIALNEAGINELDKDLVGPTAIAVSKIDEVTPARIIPKFKKEVMEGKEFPSFKAGYVDGNYLNASELEKLAALPSKEELLAKMLAGFNAPITGFVGALSGIVRKFVYVVDAIAQKEEN